MTCRDRPDKARELAHPSIEAIVAYGEARLDAEARRSVEAHLDSCADCAELLVEFAAFAEAQSPEDRQEGRIAGRAVMDRLRTEKLRRWLPVAASLVLVVGGALVWSLRSPQLPGEVPQFRVALGIRGSTATVLIPSKAHQFELLVAGDGVQPNARVDVQVEDSKGRLVLSLPRLATDSMGVLRVRLESKSLRDDLYHFRVVSPAGEEPQSVVSFSVRAKFLP